MQENVYATHAQLTGSCVTEMLLSRKFEVMFFPYGITLLMGFEPQTPGLRFGDPTLRTNRPTVKKLKLKKLFQKNKLFHMEMHLSPLAMNIMIDCMFLLI